MNIKPEKLGPKALEQKLQELRAQSLSLYEFRSRQAHSER
jgi:hypothetical protein